MDLCKADEIKALLDRHGFQFSKNMGQNFILESWVPDGLIAASGVTKNCGVLEIGPGIGPLTIRLSDAAGRVVAVELDKTLLPVLDETLSGRDNVEVVCGDILRLNLAALVDEKLAGLTPAVCANLPYNITTPALTALLECRRFSSITVLLQREAAARICAAPGADGYNAFSIYCQFYADAEVLFQVPPECFLPAPKVTSAVIRLVPRSGPPAGVGDSSFFFRVVKAAFAQRRKTLLNALGAGGFGDREALRQAIETCGLPADVRGERLDIPAFAALANLLRH